MEDIRNALRAMSAIRMLPIRKSIVGSVAFFMLNALDSTSKMNFYAARIDAARILRAVSCIVHGHIMDPAVILRDASSFA